MTDVTQLYDSAAARAIDQLAIQRFGLSGYLLMERAGRAVADVVAQRASERSVVVLCGKGNNAGDGYVIARRLRELGQKVAVLALAAPTALTGDAALAYAAWRQAGGTECVLSDDLALLLATLAERPVLVDAVLGTGLRAPLHPPWLSLFKTINNIAQREGLEVIAVDIPSGVSADTGEVIGAAIQACRTLTIGFEKLGLRIWPGQGLAGQVQVVDIGYPKALLEQVPASAALLGKEQFDSFSSASADAHKGSFGSLMIVGGSYDLPGAPALVARGALRAGCGRVYVYSEAGGHACLLPEAMRKGGRLLWEQLTLADLLQGVLGASAMVLGPGLGRTPERLRLIQGLIEHTQQPVLVDADALYALPACNLQKVAGRLVLTPHAGEAAALLGWSVAELQARRLAAVKALQQKFSATVVLKGAGSLVYDGQQLAVSPVADAALAIPGAGDVLAGVIGALLAAGQPPFKAAVAGVWAHGHAASLLLKRGNLASELADAVAAVVFRRL